MKPRRLLLLGVVLLPGCLVIRCGGTRTVGVDEGRTRVEESRPRPATPPTAGGGPVDTAAGADSAAPGRGW